MRVAYIFVGIMCVIEIGLIFGAFGCSGAPFTLIDPAPTIDSDVFGDAGLDVAPVKVPRPDSPFEGSLFDSSAFEGSLFDSSYEADSPDSGAEASIEAEAAPTCTPVAPYDFACGTNLATTTSPGQFCLAFDDVTSVTGQPMPMPLECRCKETYICACLLVAIPQPCQGRAFTGCGVGNGPALRVGCR